MVRNTIGKLSGALLCFGLAACGQTGIRNAVITPEKNLPRPSRILVYDFAVSEREVTEYQGIMRQQPTIKDPAERSGRLRLMSRMRWPAKSWTACARWDSWRNGQAAARRPLATSC